MASLNQVQLIGNLCADPEIKSFSNGGRIAMLRVATNEAWKDKTTGERKERAEFHSVVINGDGLVGVAERFLRKGSKVFVQGQLRTRKWQDQSGNDRYSTEIVLSGFGGILTMLDGKQQDGGHRRDGGSNDPSNMHGGPTPADLDDEIPF